MWKDTLDTQSSAFSDLEASFDREEVLRDYRLACLSREVSILGRREVLTGKAKFGIFGDGKEVPQVALAHYVRKGDWRAGYYRDQTLIFALDVGTPHDFFAQLYADALHDPFSGGRQMNAHFMTPTIDEQGNWLDLRARVNSSADVSSTANQMARALGLALASKKFRELPELEKIGPFSRNGNEVVICTIGDASTSEGVFWETINAAGVMQVPLAVFVWDDGYGISVPKEYQTTKRSISEVLSGFQPGPTEKGVRIHRVKAWDYEGLRRTFSEGLARVRELHEPAVFHVVECTQPQGHSTSGSHERYKSKERLRWEAEYDGIKQMGDWMVAVGIASREEVNQIRDEAKKLAKQIRDEAWKRYQEPIRKAFDEMRDIFQQLKSELPQLDEFMSRQIRALTQHPALLLADIVKLGRQVYFRTAGHDSPARARLAAWLDKEQEASRDYYHKNFFADMPRSALNVPVIPPKYSENSPLKNGYEILNTFFDRIFEKHPHVFAFGEDVGKIGGVNQAFAGLQAKFGESRIFDTGIREWTIMGQAIGMAMRGLRPIGEIQYLDYLIYGLEPLNDDLATLRYRSDGKQKAPAIVRTRGHRLEGIWHTGSPMGMLLNAIRGMYLCVPRNMVQAAGMYNTLLQSDEPGIIIERLNAYRLKERLPDNIGEYTVPMGMPEVLQEGNDVTIVTYGSCVPVAEEAMALLEEFGISVELIDVQTLLPFDLEGVIVHSLAKTNRVVFLDEDVPGGATAYMMQQVLEVQGGYRYLDSEPVTVTAAEHRTPYGTDGDYFAKPNAEDVFEAVYRLIYEAEPDRLPPLR